MVLGKTLEEDPRKILEVGSSYSPLADLQALHTQEVKSKTAL